MKLKNIGILLLVLCTVVSALGWQPGPWQQDHVYFDVYWEDFDLYVVSGTDTTKIDGGQITCVHVTTDTLTSGYVLVQIITQTDTITTYADPQVTFLEDAQFDSTVTITGNLTVNNKVLADTLDTANDATQRFQEDALFDSTLTVTQNLTANNKALIDTLDTANDAVMRFQEDGVFDSTLSVTGKVTLSDTLALNTVGVIASNQTQVNVVPDLTITGGKITFGNAETVDNETNGQILVTADSTSLSGRLIVTGEIIGNNRAKLDTLLAANDAQITVQEDVVFDSTVTVTGVLSLSNSVKVDTLDAYSDAQITFQEDVVLDSTLTVAKLARFNEDVWIAGNDLWITDSTGADSLRIYDDGSGTYIKSDNSMYFQPAGGTNRFNLYSTAVEVVAPLRPEANKTRALGAASYLWSRTSTFDIALSDTTNGDYDGWIYASDDGNVTAHKLGWDDGLDAWNVSDDVIIDNTLTVFPTGVKLTGSDGGVTILGLGNGYDEDLALDLDNTENAVMVTSSTGVTKFDLGTIDLETDVVDASTKVTTPEVENAGNITLDPAVDGASYVNISNSGTGAAQLYIEGDQINSDDLSDVASIGMLDENESLTGNWVNTTNPWADNEVAAFATGTKGDVHYASGTNTWTELGIGSDNQMLVVATDVPNWETASSDLLSDVASIAMLDENESISGTWTFGSNILFNAATHNIGASTNHVDTLFVSTIQPASILAILDSISVTGNIAGTTIGGITQANLADLTAAESITGDWVNTTYPWADNEVADDITASNYTLLTAVGDSADAGVTRALAIAKTISGDWVNTTSPWADNEVADDITASNYTLLAAVGDSADAGVTRALAIAKTISGDWVNTTNPWADNEVANDLTIATTTTMTTGHVIPTTGDLYNLGSATVAWDSLWVGDAVISGTITGTAGGDISLDIDALNEEVRLGDTGTAGEYASVDSVGTLSTAPGGVTFLASDSDAGNIVQNTSDQMVLSGASGGYTFDSQILANGGAWITGGDTLLITDSTGADSLRVYDDGSGVYVKSDNPIYFQPGGSSRLNLYGTTVEVVAPLRPEANKTRTLGMPNYLWSRTVTFDIALSDTTTGDYDGWIYASDDGSVTAHKFGWDDGLDTWYANDDLILDNTGASVNSPALSFLGDAAGTELEASIYLAQGADPYLRISVDDDSATPALTAVIDIHDQVIAFATDNITDIGASGANRPKDYFGAGNITTAGYSTATDMRMPTAAPGAPANGSFYLGTADTMWVYSGSAWKYTVLSTL